MLDRLSSPTPKFFVKARNFCLAIAALCASLAPVSDKIPFITPIVLIIGGVAGATGAFFSQLTKKDE
jgi:hypothetical protein